METNPSSCVDNQCEMAEEANIDVGESMIKDIRKYLCQYCGISRSKKYLITKHILSEHKMEIEEELDDEACDVEVETSGKHTCQECGAGFKKPAHLKQHMLSHSIEVEFCVLMGYRIILILFVTASLSNLSLILIESFRESTSNGDA